MIDGKQALEYIQSFPQLDENKAAYVQIFRHEYQYTNNEGEDFEERALRFKNLSRLCVAKMIMNQQVYGKANRLIFNEIEIYTLPKNTKYYLIKFEEKIEEYLRKGDDGKVYLIKNPVTYLAMGIRGK